MEIIHVTEATFKQEVLESDKPVLVDFWATWCGPCKALAPRLEEADSQLNSEVKIAKINIDEEEELAAQFRVMSIPTLLLFKNGTPVEKSVGLVSTEELLEFAKK